MQRDSGLIRRGKKGLFTLIHHTPDRYKSVETRREVFTALRTSDEEEARAKSFKIKAEQIAIWEARIAGRSNDEQSHAERLAEIAQGRGYKYTPADTLAAGSIESVLRRIAALPEVGHQETVDALLGSRRQAPAATFKLSELFQTYSDLTASTRTDKNPDQIRRWENPRKKAIKNFLSVTQEDPLIDEISRDSVLDFRRWWWERIESGEIAANSANKDFMHLSAMVGQTLKLHGIEQKNPFREIKFAENPSKPPPFSREWIERKILAPNALEKLNNEARDIIHILINTGARPNELAGLAVEDIILNAEIPHIKIRPNEHRAIKNRSSRRDIPLIGVSLEAAERHPKGFSRYQKNSAGLSGTIMKSLRANNLLETPDHVCYSLRHTFQDSLQNIDCPHRTTKELMGHTVEGISYGNGASLETKRKWLTRIAFNIGTNGPLLWQRTAHTGH